MHGVAAHHRDFEFLYQKNILKLSDKFHLIPKLSIIKNMN